MMRTTILLAVFGVSQSLLAQPFTIADITIESRGTDTVVIVSNTACSILQFPKLLKTQVPMIMGDIGPSGFLSGQVFNGTVLTNLLKETRLEPYIHVTLGRNTTRTDLDRLRSLFWVVGATNVSIGTNDIERNMIVDRDREPHR